MHHDLYQAFAMSSAFNFSVSSFSHFEFESLLKKKNESFLSFLHKQSLETVLANKRIGEFWQKGKIKGGMRRVCDMQCTVLLTSEIVDRWLLSLAFGLKHSLILPCQTLKTWNSSLVLLSFREDSSLGFFSIFAPVDSYRWHVFSSSALHGDMKLHETPQFFRLSQGFIVCPSKRKSLLL